MPDAIGDYLNKMGKIPLLTKDDEQRLGKLVAAGQEAEKALQAEGLSGSERRALQRTAAKGKRAKDDFVVANLRLVVYTAKRYQWSGMRLEDLVSEGTLGLIHAIEKFDWQRGFRFSTYATWWIRQSLGRAIEQHARSIRLPAFMEDNIRRVITTRDEWAGEHGREPTRKELAKLVNLPVTMVEYLLALDEKPLSMDIPLFEGDEGTFSDIVADARVNVEDGVIREVVEPLRDAIAALPDADRELVHLRWGDGTQTQVDHMHRYALNSQDSAAKHFGMSQTNYRTQERRVKRRLRDAINAAS